MTDYYGVLGVARDATPDEIKTAYRRRSSEVHPDKVGGDSGPMAAVNRAYETLSNPVQRAIYDAGGEEAVLSATDMEKAATLRLKQHMEGMLRAIVMHGQQFQSLTQALKDNMAVALMGEVDKLDNAKESLEALKRQKGRVKRKDGGESLYESIVDEQIIACSASIAQGELSVKISERALLMLDELAEGGGNWSQTLVTRLQFFTGG